VDTSIATIDENNILTVTDSAEITITASLAEDPNIADTITTTFYIRKDTSATDTTEDDTTTGINSRHTKINKLQCSIYPNPANQFIQLEGISHCEIKIFNTLGKLIYEDIHYDKGENINLNGLKNGVYLIRIKQGNQRTVKRFIKRE
jgi:hypothetical protein